jgi:hypothetical protein
VLLFLRKMLSCQLNLKNSFVYGLQKSVYLVIFLVVFDYGQQNKLSKHEQALLFVVKGPPKQVLPIIIFFLVLFAHPGHKAGQLSHFLSREDFIVA